jgi:hypothetical protein
MGKTYTIFSLTQAFKAKLFVNLEEFVNILGVVK